MSQIDLQADIRRVEDPADPRRCQSMTSNGQCLNKALEGVSNCSVHNGNSQVNSNARKSTRMYRLNKWQDKISKMADNPKLKSLNEEVGILRVMLEETINKCKTEHDLILQSAVISDLIGKIERLVNSCHKLDKDLKVMLDKNEAVQLADTLLAIILKNIKDEVVLESVSTAFEEAITKMGTID